MPKFTITYYYYLARQELQEEDENHVEKEFRKNPNIKLSINFRLEAF